MHCCRTKNRNVTTLSLPGNINAKQTCIYAQGCNKEEHSGASCSKVPRQPVTKSALQLHDQSRNDAAPQINYTCNWVFSSRGRGQPSWAFFFVYMSLAHKQGCDASTGKNGVSV